MNAKRTILIVGGGTAGWLSAAYLAKFLEITDHGYLDITLIESPDIGIVGVGEGTFPTIRNTLKFIGIDEAQFMRSTTATFKQGIRFNDWVRTPKDGVHEHYFHPFEAPFYTEGAGLVPYWLLQDEATRLPFAQAMTFQKRVAEARRAPKRPHEGDFAGPLNYAYHFDATRLAEVVADRARELGVRHIRGNVRSVELDATGSIDHIVTDTHGELRADLYIDCSGFRAELIGRALGVPLKSVRHQLFTDRAISCRLPYDRPDTPIESFTISTAQEAGWIWDIGLTSGRGIGYVYSSAHTTDDKARQVLHRYTGRPDIATRLIPFEPGYRERQWVGNCVAVGLAAGFLEPLEATGVVLIEVAVSMIAELFPHNGPADASAQRFNELIVQRYDNIINFLKLHYALSQRKEAFWRDNTAPSSIPERLRHLLEQWRFRPPGRYDFLLDLESFAFFNYQYILYGMGFRTDLTPVRDAYPNVEQAERVFARIKNFGERATLDLPSHRALLQQIYEGGFSEMRA
ncbi:MAG: tryptophan halogenase family protein [Asticcacaulis sp.]